MRARFTLIAITLALATAACMGGTKLTAVWKAPGATSVRFNKVLVAVVSSDQLRRRVVEDRLVQRIANSTPSYKFLTEADVKDQAQAKAKVQAGGFDGALIVRFVGTTKEESYVPGASYWGPAPYSTMWGYWGYGWGAVYSPGYMVSDTIITLESNVYAVARDELLWSSRSETMNPDSLNDMMNSVIDATVKEMKKQKVL
jgi:hypothetical protein